MQKLTTYYLDTSDHYISVYVLNDVIHKTNCNRFKLSRTYNHYISLLPIIVVTGHKI